MDEFDSKIRNTVDKYEPNTNFVGDTMDTINNTEQQPIAPIEPIEVQKQPFWKSRGFKIFAPSVTGLAALAIIAVILWPHGSNQSTTTPAAPSTQASTQTTATNPNDVADTSLDSDLSAIQSSMNQTSSDQSSADNSLNDSSQQIAVPTQ